MIDIKDVIKEGKKGNIEAVAGLSEDQTVGILANAKKDIEQPANVISEKGLGAYGLTLANLQDLKIVKAGVKPGADLEATLSDASVFTGKRGVNNSQALLGNESLQKTLTQEVIVKNTASLQRQGIISGTEPPEIAAGIAGAAAKYDVKDLKDFANGAATPEIAEGIALTQKGADFAVNLTDTKASSALAKVKGIGGGALKKVKSATETISIPQLNKNVDDFIGSKRVPSAVTEKDIAALAEQAKSAVSVPANALTGVTKSVDSVTGSLGSLTDSVESTVGSLGSTALPSSVTGATGKVTSSLSKAEGTIKKGDLF